MTGSLCVPNVGLGDIEVRFNHHDASDRARALKMLTDMQARGYAILVRLDDGSYARAETIDATTGHYVVTLPEDATLAESEPVPAKRKRGRPRKVRVPVERAHATGIARSAGG